MDEEDLKKMAQEAQAMQEKLLGIGLSAIDAGQKTARLTAVAQLLHTKPVLCVKCLLHDVGDGFADRIEVHSGEGFCEKHVPKVPVAVATTAYRVLTPYEHLINLAYREALALMEPKG